MQTGRWPPRLPMVGRLSFVGTRKTHRAYKTGADRRAYVSSSEAGDDSAPSRPPSQCANMLAGRVSTRSHSVAVAVIR